MITLHYAADLRAGIFQTRMPMLFATGDQGAHEIRVTVTEDGQPASLTGRTVSGYFIRADRSTVLLSGSAEGNTARVTLSQSCYVQPGGFSLFIKTGVAGETAAVFWGVGTVVRSTTDTIVDPSETIPSLEELLAQIDAMEAATTAAQSATSAANTAAGAANTAAGQATTAASNASTAAGQANTAAGNASTAAGAANTAAQTANTAAQKIDGMTVSAAGLTAESSPTAVISDVDGHKHVAFGIPAGQTGPKGDTGATPDISIGTVTTGAPGTEASATMTGTSESPVLNLTIPRGDPGDLDNIPWYTGTPSAAGTASPGTSDQVARGDHVHPMPTAAQVGAYPESNIRSLAFSIAVSAWTGAGPYTYTITEGSVTEHTWCDFTMTSAVQALLTADVTWTTSAGKIVLSTTSKPTGTISGTLILMEVDG